ncbi:MAG: FAD-dependent oxidoreductase [Alphaproteobacteria bacterium]|nr:FAD-dependent oxidoreductase [Alphaproteobacteria bacterium]
MVGGGIAGLVAAHRLVEAGATKVTVYEASRRIGGRMLTGRNAVGDGTLVEFGGSFINTEHADMLALCREFGLALEDGAAGEDAGLSATYFIDGAARTLREIADAGTELVGRLDALRAETGDEAEARHDAKSAAQLLDEFKVTGWLRRLLDVGLTQEMGLEPDRMSALYLIESFSPDPALPKRGLFHSDQRFQIVGGNDRLPAALAAKLGARIRHGHRLEAVRRRGQAYALAFAEGGTSKEVVADIVILTLPTTTLRDVRLEIGLSPLARRAIRETTYGTNAKLFAGVSARPWRAQGRSGECLNDLGFQTVWEDHARGGTGAGALTIFGGGRTGVGFGRGTPVERAREVTRRLERAFPGAAAAFTGKGARMHWPSNPWVRGSYSCFAPRQMTAFADAFEPVGRVVFAGEHTSEDHSGYMNGGAESGRLAAETVVKLLV